MENTLAHALQALLPALHAPADISLVHVDEVAMPTVKAHSQHAFAHSANSSSLGMRVTLASAAISFPEQLGRSLMRA